MKMMDRSGKRYGRLVALEPSEVRRYKSGHTEVIWRCQCDCGNETNVSSGRLASGMTRSCGCLRKDTNVERNTTHAMSRTKLYRVWGSIKDRCYRQSCAGYKNYGARGIEMDIGWKNDFTTFHDWAMANGYADGLTIERKDVNGNYEPSNCEFIPKSLQSKNRRNCHYISYNGETKTLSEWSRQYHIDRECLRNKEKQLGSGEEALKTFLIRKGVIHSVSDEQELSIK